MGSNSAPKSKGDVEKLPPGRWPVGAVEGLSIRVVGNSRRYYLRMKAEGRRVEIPLGSSADLTPRQAEQKALAYKAGVVPPPKPKIEKTNWAAVAKRAEALRLHTFKAAMDAYVQAHAAEWKGGAQGRHGLTLTRMLSLHALPAIGGTPCEEITVDQVLAILRPIWATKAETARRLLTTITTVIKENLSDRDLPNTDAVDREKLRMKLKVKHVSNVGRDATLTGKAQGRRGSHPAPSLPTLNRFIHWATRGDASISSLAVAFLAFTAVRSQSVRAADWRQFDFRRSTWTIPAEFSKSGIDHVVPLSAAAIYVLKRRRVGEEWPAFGLIFPAPKGGPLSDMALSQCVKGWVQTHKAPVWVPHGLRGAFKAWTIDTELNSELAELALGHLPSRDKVANAYSATGAVEKRRAIMGAWAQAIKYGTAHPPVAQGETQDA